jgi:hypothetical protein
MEPRLENTPRYSALIIVGVLAALASGCGDELTRGGGAFSSALASHVKDELGGPQVELTTFTSCEGTQSKNPETRCEGVQSAEIEVFFDGESLVFDFSNAPKSGAISDRGFEGYVFSRTEHSKLRTFRDATIDAERASVDAELIQIELDGTSVVVDFRGLEYDDTTFIKVDLIFQEE